MQIRRPSEDPTMPTAGPYHSFMASLHIALGEGVSSYPSSVYNVVDPQRVSSQSLAGHALRVPQHSAEGAAGALRNSQAALRVPRTTPESVPGSVLGSGKPLFRTPPETLVSAALASTGVSGGGASAALRDRINILQVQSVSTAVVGGIKPSQPGQVAFAGQPAWELYAAKNSVMIVSEDRVFTLLLGWYLVLQPHFAGRCFRSSGWCGCRQRRAVLRYFTLPRLRRRRLWGRGEAIAQTNSTLGKVFTPWLPPSYICQWYLFSYCLRISWRSAVSNVLRFFVQERKHVATTSKAAWAGSGWHFHRG